MPVYQSRTQRRQNAVTLEQREYATGRLVKSFLWFGGGVGAGMFGLAFADEFAWRGWPVFMYVSHFAAALMLSFGLAGILLWQRLAFQPVPEDEIEYRTMAHDAAPGDARLMVRTTPQQISVGHLGIDRHDRLPIGYTLKRDGWKWRREVFRDASITNYTAKYTNANRAARELGMIDANGFVREQFQAWWTSPTPQIVDHYSIDGSDDDPSSGVAGQI